MKDPDFEPEVSGRKRSSLLVICLGCSLLLFVALLVLCAAGGYFTYLAYEKVDEFASVYEAKGYDRVTGQVHVISQPVNSPRVYTSQVLKVNADVNADLAVMAQVVEIHATVDGDIDFKGQLLIVKPEGVVTGDIRVEAGQVIEIQGIVKGKITGSYQVLKNDRAKDAKDVAEVSDATDAAADEP